MIPFHILTPRFDAPMMIAWWEKLLFAGVVAILVAMVFLMTTGCAQISGEPKSCDTMMVYRHYGDSLQRLGKAKTMCGWMRPEMAAEYPLCTGFPIVNSTQGNSCQDLAAQEAQISYWLEVTLPPAKKTCSEDLANCSSFLNTNEALGL